MTLSDLGKYNHMPKDIEGYISSILKAPVQPFNFAFLAPSSNFHESRWTLRQPHTPMRYGRLTSSHCRKPASRQKTCGQQQTHFDRQMATFNMSMEPDTAYDTDDQTQNHTQGIGHRIGWEKLGKSSIYDQQQREMN